MDVLEEVGPIFAALGAAAVALLAAEVLNRIARGLARRVGKQKDGDWPDTGRIRLDRATVGRYLEWVVDRLYRPFQLLLGTFAAWGAIGIYQLSTDEHGALLSILLASVIIAGIWLLINALLVVVSPLVYLLRFGGSDAARRFHNLVETTSRVISLLVAAVIVLVSVAALDRFYDYSWEVLTAGGIIAAAAGLAAQNSLSNTFAGIALGINKSLNVGDVVEIDGESGRIAERTLNYLVVVLSGQRRLVVPSSYLLQMPYRSWRITKTRVVGWVPLEMDWSVPVAEVKKAVEDIRDAAENSTDIGQDAAYDHLCGLLRGNPQPEPAVEVMGMADGRIQLRVRVVALPDHLWDLQCAVRWYLVEWLHNKHPEALPKVRAEIVNLSGSAASPVAVPSQPHPGRQPAPGLSSSDTTSSWSGSSSDLSGDGDDDY